MTEAGGSKRITDISAFCAVCGSPNHGTHFGVLSCRACSSFFRRTIFERKTYKCRKRNNCDILKAGMRNACRACRMQHCLEAGMHADYDWSQESIALDSKLDLSPPGLFGSSKAKIFVEMNTETPLLDHYLLGIRNYYSGQRSLFTIRNPDTIFSSPKYKHISQEEFLKMDKGSIALLYTMCVNYFNPFDSFSHEQKVTILKYFWGQFTFIHHSYLTSSYLNEETKEGEDIVVDKLVTHYGYYINLDSLKRFFSDKIDNSDDHIRFCEPLLKVAFQNVKKLIKLKITEQELAALVGIIFWNSVEKFGLLNEVMEEKRKAIISDLNHLEIRNFGFQDGIARTGRLFCYAQEIIVNRLQMNDTLDVGKIFLPLFRDVWDEETCPVPADSDNTRSMPIITNEPSQNGRHKSD